MIFINDTEITFRAIPTSRKEIRRVAKYIREYFKIDDNSPLPVPAFLEIFCYCCDYNYQIVEDSALPSCYALTKPYNRTILINKSTYLSACNGEPRARFTIVHEIGHAIFHNESSTIYTRSRSAKIIRAFENPEWQANTFAAEILVPYYRINGLSVDEIAKKYLVSKKVAQIQSSFTKIPA